MSFKVYLPSEAEKLIFKSPDVEITLDSGRSITELLLVFHKAIQKLQLYRNESKVKDSTSFTPAQDQTEVERYCCR